MNSCWGLVDLDILHFVPCSCPTWREHSNVYILMLTDEHRREHVCVWGNVEIYYRSRVVVHLNIHLGGEIQTYKIFDYSVDSFCCTSVIKLPACTESKVRHQVTHWCFCRRQRNYVDNPPLRAEQVSHVIQSITSIFRFTQNASSRHERNSGSYLGIDSCHERESIGQSSNLVGTCWTNWQLAELGYYIANKPCTFRTGGCGTQFCDLNSVRSSTDRSCVSATNHRERNRLCGVEIALNRRSSLIN